jgi:ribosomal protein L14
MDRGRAGGFVTDNNYSGLQVKRKMQREHLARLEKIRLRKAGSSVTLDNNAPVVIDAMVNNPRKHASRDHFNYVIENENK